jgi:alkyldihydroxyacetonephosphate synthase
LVLAFESADHPTDPWLNRALEIATEHRGTVSARRSRDTAGDAANNDASANWRSAFLRMPYQRDALARRGVIAETFETACTWDGFNALHAAVTEAARTAIEGVCGAGAVTCRFTHVYPDGPAPYYGIYAAGRWGSLDAQWDEIKAAVSEAVVAAGGTITHHHAVGRDHRPWYDRQRPDPFAAAMRAAKSALDPAGILNPGVLVDTDKADQRPH